MAEGPDQRVVVVTGGASGIGRATAQAFRRDGEHVVTLDRAETDLPGWRHDHVVTDVADQSQLAAAAEVVRASSGRCHVLVTCAGVAPVGDAAACEEADWEQAFSVNTRGTWLTFKTFLPLMSDGGILVTIASAAGLRPLRALAAYSASKAAVIALTRSIAVDFAAQGIRANCICPGVIDTPLARQAQDRRPERERAEQASLRDYPLGRVGTAEEVAAAAAYLASPEAAFITGATLAVDGGRSLH